MYTSEMRGQMGKREEMIGTFISSITRADWYVLLGFGEPACSKSLLGRGMKRAKCKLYGGYLLAVAIIRKGTNRMREGIVLNPRTYSSCL